MGGQAGKGQRSNLVVSASVNTTDVAEGSDLDPAAPAAKSALHRGGRGCLAGRSRRNVTRRKEKFAGGVFHSVMMGEKKKKPSESPDLLHTLGWRGNGGVLLCRI